MHNPTCIWTGKKENLVMKKITNSGGDMVGWIFVNEDYLDIDIYFSIKCALTSNSGISESFIVDALTNPTAQK